MDVLYKVLSIGAGGAVGAVVRYLVNISPLSRVFEKFPLPTFCINISGSFLIGFLLILFTDKLNVGENFRMAVLVGVLGAFTTFSTFELEIYGLVKEGAYLIAFAYLFLSVLVGFVGVVAGITLAGKL